MYTFIIGICILFGGGIAYAFVLRRVFGINQNHKTIAFTKRDNVDYVPMNKFRNAAIQLKSIAGTGPILGPIQGILFGPIAFLTIPIGNILGGITHDTYSGLMSMRNGGAQMPDLLKRYIGKICQIIFLIMACIVALLVSALFLSMPGTIISGSIAHKAGPGTNTPYTSSWILWLVIGLLFVYYVAATLFPIDKIIGKVYPLLSILLIGGTIALLIGSCIDGGLNTTEIWNGSGIIPIGSGHFVPLFFVTITCGMISGFHSTQSTIVGRAVQNEKHTIITFSLPMIIEGAFAMIWALVAMSLFNNKPDLVPSDPNQLNPSAVLGPLTQGKLGVGFGDFILIVIAMEAVTTGDTALRSTRLIVADFIKVDQKPMKKRLLVAIPIFAISIGLLFVVLYKSAGFAYMWQYFAWADQVTIAFTFAAITVYLMRRQRFYWIALIPGGWYTFIPMTAILASPKIGFNQIPGVNSHALWICAYVIGGLAALAFMLVVWWWGHYTSKKPGVFIEDKQENIATPNTLLNEVVVG